MSRRCYQIAVIPLILEASFEFKADQELRYQQLREQSHMISLIGFKKFGDVNK